MTPCEGLDDAPVFLSVAVNSAQSRIGLLHQALASIDHETTSVVRQAIFEDPVIAVLEVSPAAIVSEDPPVISDRLKELFPSKSKNYFLSLEIMTLEAETQSFCVRYAIDHPPGSKKGADSNATEAHAKRLIESLFNTLPNAYVAHLTPNSHIAEG